MPTQTERVKRARVALEAFIAHDLPAYRDEDEETQLSDLYCDLRHLADQLGLDWEQIVARGNNHYVAEVGDAPAHESSAATRPQQLQLNQHHQQALDVARFPLTPLESLAVSVLEQRPIAIVPHEMGQRTPDIIRV